jgi:hypothetical protein
MLRFIYSIGGMMDPNATLAEIRKICTSWQEWGTLENDPASRLDDLSELVYDLDQWLTTGGFRPDDWS